MVEFLGIRQRRAAHLELRLLFFTTLRLFFNDALAFLSPPPPPVLSCDKQDLYFALPEKIKSRPIAARGGRVCCSTFDSRGLGFTWRHPLLCAPPAETRKDALKARLQHLRVRAYENIASPSSARPALQHHPALSAGFTYLHAGSAVLPFRLLYISRCYLLFAHHPNF